jgi:hypothetical protein
MEERVGGKVTRSAATVFHSFTSFTYLEDIDELRLPLNQCPEEFTP